MRQATYLISITVLWLCLCQNATAAVWSITYPKSEIENDLRYDYPLALLDLALQKTGVRYELKPSINPMRQARSLKRLEENLEVNVVWSVTDKQREETLRPIRIPITRGLIGWRVFVHRQENPVAKFKITSLEQLLAKSHVQGITWPDTKVLQANGFNVVTSRDYIEATSMLNTGLADFFPRSIIEALPELQNPYSSKFSVKKGLIVYYPAAMYFFTNKQNLTLSKLIETGLQRAIEDGSFETLFYAHFEETLDSLNAKNAQFFRLANPLLPPLTPIAESSYWLLPNSLQE